METLFRTQQGGTTRLLSVSRWLATIRSLFRPAGSGGRRGCNASSPSLTDVLRHPRLHRLPDARRPRVLATATPRASERSAAGRQLHFLWLVGPAVSRPDRALDGRRLFLREGDRRQ